MSDLCRFCAEYKPLEDLSCITDDDSTITFKLESSLKIVLDNDKLLPKSACSTCLNALDIAFKFAEQVASVQEKLKTDLQEKLNSMQINSNIDELDVMKNFEIKIERLDTSLYEFLPSAEVSVKGKTTNKRSTESKKEPKNVSKKRIGRRTFGLTKPIKITMDSLFKEELKGNFVGATEEMDIDDEDKMPLGTLSSRAKDRLATIGWCNYEWKCRECGETFSNVIQLEKHSIKAHKKRCIIHCEPCFDIYKNYTRFLDHVTTKHQPLLKFSCIICSEIRTSYRHLYDHIAEAHPDYSVFLCLYCGEIKFAGSIMKDHIADYHVPVANKFSCDLCEKTFNTKSKICNHMAYTHAQRSFICEWCAASYRQQHELSSHQNYHHTDLYNESCSFCKEVFKNKYQLQAHVRIKHREANLEVHCDVCGFRSVTKGGHAAHMKRHSDKVLKCNFCDRTFKHNSSFRYHLSTHTGERRYMCPVEGCGKRDADWANSNKHIKATHGVKGLKPIRFKSSRPDMRRNTQI